MYFYVFSYTSVYAAAAAAANSFNKLLFTDCFFF